MSGGLRRSLADLACRALQAALPPSLQSWGWAVRCETAGITDDTKALLFAIDSLCGLMPRAVASHLLHPFASLIGAVLLGLAYMAAAGAPMRYLGTNLGALVIGLMALALLRRVRLAGRQLGSQAIMAIAALLLATALLGERAGGAARWVNVGGLSIQSSLVLVPVMLVAFVQNRSVLSTMAVIVAATALAIQPDRAMAGMLAAGLAVLLAMCPDKHVATAFVASIAGFFATLVRTDALPATPYVDQILFSAFDSHLAAGAAVLIGSALLLVPAIVGWRRDPANRATYAVFGAAWFAGIMAAALGHYPTPIVGYGGSAIIGYALSLLALPLLSSEHGVEASPTSGEADGTPFDRHFAVALS
jgi:hypothetical protein